jgi:hypothetical protein
VPQSRRGKKTKAVIEYELLVEHPYERKKLSSKGHRNFGCRPWRNATAGTVINWADRASGDVCHRPRSFLVSVFMASSGLMGLTTDAWVAIASVAFYLLVAVPVLAVCLYAAWRRSADAHDQSVADVARFVALRERARSELAETGSFDRFRELKDEARRQLWPTASERARLRRSAAQPAPAPPVATPSGIEESTAKERRSHALRRLHRHGVH